MLASVCVVFVLCRAVTFRRSRPQRKCTNAHKATGGFACCIRDTLFSAISVHRLMVGVTHFPRRLTPWQDQFSLIIQSTVIFPCVLNTMYTPPASQSTVPLGCCFRVGAQFIYFPPDSYANPFGGSSIMKVPHVAFAVDYLQSLAIKGFWLA